MALHERILYRLAATLNPAALKSCFIMEEFSRFSRILADLVGYKISPLENKKGPKNGKKTLFFPATIGVNPGDWEGHDPSDFGMEGSLVGRGVSMNNYYILEC